MTPRFVQKNAAIVLLLFSAGCGGGGSSGGAMIEEVSGSNNSDPLTVATGFDQVLPKGYGTTQLTATASSSGSVTWAWQQTSGTSVVLANADTERMSFTTALFAKIGNT